MSRVYKQTSFTSDDLFATVSFGGGGGGNGGPRRGSRKPSKPAVPKKPIQSAVSVTRGHPSAMSASQYYVAGGGMVFLGAGITAAGGLAFVTGSLGGLAESMLK